MRHGLRGLLKSGHPGALAAVGVSVDDVIDVAAFSVEPAVVAIGDAVTVTCTLVGRGRQEVGAQIDPRVHYANAAGALTRRKTFRFARRTLLPDSPEAISRSIAFRPVSIRALQNLKQVLTPATTCWSGRSTGASWRVSRSTSPPEAGGAHGPARSIGIPCGR